jgi:hypothetical protein
MRPLETLTPFFRSLSMILTKFQDFLREIASTVILVGDHIEILRVH